MVNCDNSENAEPRSATQKAARKVRLLAEGRRQQILSAALAEFSAVGFEGATRDRIAQRTGLARAGLYAHFASKDDLLEALLVSNIFNLSEPSVWQISLKPSLEPVLPKHRRACNTPLAATADKGDNDHRWFDPTCDRQCVLSPADACHHFWIGVCIGVRAFCCAGFVCVVNPEGCV